MTAILWLGLALQVAPELKQHVEAGLAAKRAGDLDTAIREFESVVKLAPGMAAAHVNLGAVYYARKDYGHAVPSLRRALEINPDLPGAQEMLGVALLAQGYAAEAIPHLENTGTQGLLGVALLEAGRAREAVDKLEAALENSRAIPTCCTTSARRMRACRGMSSMR
jgi:Tfp pilus assembly protein PilF